MIISQFTIIRLILKDRHLPMDNALGVLQDRISFKVCGTFLVHKNFSENGIKINTSDYAKRRGEGGMKKKFMVSINLKKRWDIGYHNLDL